MAEEEKEAQPPSSEHAQRLLDFLRTHKDELSPLLILPHDFPDPDALATAYALHYLAKQKFDIESRIAYRGLIGRPENREMVKLLKIPARRLHKIDFKRYRKVALVDTQPCFRNNPFPGNRRATLVIDQHASHRPPLADLALIDTECGASCVIVAEALLRAGGDMPQRLATALAYGILSDTQDLYRAGRPDVVQTYLKVLHQSDMKLLARIQNPPRTKSFFVTLGRCICRAEKYRRLVVSHLGEVKNPDLVAQMADFLLTYDHANWAFCSGRYKGRLYVSLRTNRTDVQAGEILRDVFENRNLAGGHRTIAGGSMRVGLAQPEEVWESAEEGLQLKLVKRLRMPLKGEFWKPFKR
jgi:nanoRNase/pAp phosphatase (c-di-AMP/oligoRNAs hydrolase)